MYVYGPVTSSDQKTADAAIIVQPAFFYGITIPPPANQRTIVTVYDSENSTVAGKIILGVFTAASGQNTLSAVFPIPKVANRGIYATISGTGSYVIDYSPR